MFAVAEGVLKFTLEPPDPSYARNGSNAKLVWDYSGQAELAWIIYGVGLPGGSFSGLLEQLSDGSFVDDADIPPRYKGRVKVEGNASLVIGNITPQDNTIFRCVLVPVSGTDIVSDVQLIVTGTYCYKTQSS